MHLVVWVEFQGALIPNSLRSFSNISYRSQIAGFFMTGIWITTMLDVPNGYESVPKTESTLDRDLGKILAALNRCRRDNEVYRTNAQGLGVLVQRPHVATGAELAQGRLPAASATRSLGQSLPVHQPGGTR
jgi:hypothetical protein